VGSAEDRRSRPFRRGVIHIRERGGGLPIRSRCKIQETLGISVTGGTPFIVGHTKPYHIYVQFDPSRAVERSESVAGILRVLLQSYKVNQVRFSVLKFPKSLSFIVECQRPRPII
jgi:hypothetical protein